MSAPPDLASVSSHDTTSRPLKGIKNFIAEKRRSSEVHSDASNQTPDLKPSLTSPFPDKSPSRLSTAHSSPSRDDASSKSGSSGVRKLLPGHSKRKRRKAREKELKAAEEELSRGRSPTGVGASMPDLNRSVSSLVQEGDSGLLTDDEDLDLNSAPSLVSRESHNGYLTTSSPLLRSSAAETGKDGGSIPENSIPPAQELPQIAVSEQHGTANSLHHFDTAPAPGLVDRADSLRVESDDRGRRGSISRLRGISPGRKLKEVFTNKSSKSPRTSPERKSTDPFAGGVGNLWNKSGTLSERHLPLSPTTAPARASTFANLDTSEKASRSTSALDTIEPPRTPPGTGIGTPSTTVTPPTPTMPQHPENPPSPRRHTEAAVDPYDANTVVAPSGNMISHRRTRSGSSLKHPSKLSSSIFPPLTPTLEETRTPPSKEGDKDPVSRSATPSSGFFSSWVSAAQNAATTLTTTINTHARTASTSSKPKEAEGKASEETVRETPVAKVAPPESPKKQKAIETLGSGDLNFGHLGFDPTAEKSIGAGRPDLEDLRKNSTIQRDEASAKIEDMLARRAVSAAYEAPPDTTPIAEVPDPLQSLKHTQTGSMSLLGEQTPPNGSIFGDDSGSIKRSNSMRSRLRKRRSRGSSVATGTSTIGAAIVGASTSTLANPATGPRLSGFATAPKPRNRAFHQAFRSVPEDDYLIEDYSCALQKEILLAGRIYISEGHICFSSNILGWVTTLVISFEEIVSVERESTAMVFPNAIAIQTLHARHTFRSLLSREATFELMIGIWKVSHPASFKKSVNGKQLMQEEAAKGQDAIHDALATEEDIAKSDGESDDSDSEESDGDGSEGSDASLAGSGASMTPSDNVDAKSLKTKTSGLNASLAPPGADGAISPEGSFGLAAPTSAEQLEGLGPATHAPTDCNDASTHYEKVCKDEIIAAPLGKIYSLLYGPLSGTFVRKYLLEDQKAIDLQMDDDKKGLSNESKSRQYTYIKPLGGSIGPKQTKCITTENLDFCDFEKSVSVTCTTQTPDVPSGSAFSTKTRYCLSWAPNNSTRLQMSCGIEWTAKSWLKSPIEKGANDGQQSYGDGLVKALRAFVEGGSSPKKGASRERGATGVSKSSKKKKGRSSKSKDSGSKTKDKAAASAWGPLEPLHSLLEPIIDLLGPIAHPWTLVAILLIYMTISWIRSPSSSSLRSSSSSSLPGSAFLSPQNQNLNPARVAAYDELWRHEESDLWDWLESRTGVHNLRTGSALLSNRNDDTGSEPAKSKSGSVRSGKGGKASEKELERKLREEKMGQRAMEDMLRVTRERLDVLERVVERRGKDGTD